MKNNRIQVNKRITLLSVVLGGALLLSAACATGSSNRSPAASGLSGSSVSERSGSELWAQNCRRCHNFRSPSEFNDSSWDVAMFHMRVRANLTEEEYESIRAFIKSSN